MGVKTLNFDPDGTVLFIYDDEIAALINSLGAKDVKITRASHVEPMSSGAGWQVDMSPVGGGLYGPFESRGYALAFEVEWLKANRGL